MSEATEKEALEVDNLSLWQRIGKTDPKFTKEATTKGGFTSISAYYQIETATKEWGVYGESWGLKEIKVDYSLLEITGLAVMEAVFFCPVSSFPINNAITVKGLGSSYVDADFMKKLQTNTITKALSLLGMSNDVFKGQFDDQAYVAQRLAEEHIAASDNKEKELGDQFNKIKGLIAGDCETFKNLPTEKTINTFAIKVYAKASEKLKAYNFNPERLHKFIENKVNEAIKALKDKEES